MRFFAKTLYLIIIVSLIYGFELYSSKNQDIICISLNSDFELIDRETDTIGNYKTKSLIYIFNDIVIYKKDEFFFDLEKKMSIKYDYYYYSIKDKKGLLYEWENSFSIPLKFDVDSFKQADMYGSLTDTKLIDPKYDSLVDEIRDTNNSVIIKRYVNGLKKDDSFPDSTYLFFDKNLTEIPFSFSKNLDSLNKSKLFKIEFVFPIPEKVKSNTGRINRHFNINFEKIKNFNTDTIIMIYDKFKKDRMTLLK
jgi:hypothetical protein